MSAVTEHSTCAKNIQPHYNRSDKAREREREKLLCLFTFPDFMSSHAIQSSDTSCSLPYFLRVCVCDEEELVCVFVLRLRLVFLLCCFVFFPWLSCTRVQVFYGMDDCRVTALQKRHKQPLHREVLLPTCIGIHTVPVLIYNHLSRKHFLSHTQYVRTHTHSLMWGRICALRHMPQGPLLLLFHCQQCKICAGTAEKLGMDG